MVFHTGDAYEVLVKLRARAESFGPVESSHFAFATFKPVGKFNGKELLGIYPSGFDPTRPIGSWKKAWGKVREKAGLNGLRFHDLRHHAITELAESGTSEQTILAIAVALSEPIYQGAPIKFSTPAALPFVNFNPGDKNTERYRR
jgi:integrase